MKKIIGVVLVLLAMVVLGGPFIGGLKAEKELQKIVQAIDEYPGYQVQWLEYDRGWFATEATLSVGFDAALWPVVGNEGVDNEEADDEAAQLPSLPLNIHIDHGPLLLSEQSALGWYAWQLDLTQEQTQWLEERLDVASDEQLYQAQGHVGLFGSIEFSDELQAFTVSDEQGNVFVRTNGYSGSGTVDMAGMLSYSGVIGHMDFTSEDALLSLGDTAIRSNGDLSRMDWEHFLYPSDFFMNVSTVHVQGGDRELSVTNAVFEGALVMAEGENFFDLIATVSAGNVESSDVKVEQAAVTFAYENISVSAYEAYMDMAAAMVEAPDQQVDYQQFFTPEIMQEFIANGPAFGLRNISFSTPQGDLKGSFRLGLKEDFVMPPQMTNPLMLIQALTLDSLLDVDRPLAMVLLGQSSRAQVEESMAGDPEVTEADIDAAVQQQAQQKLDMLIAQGIVVEEGDSLQAQVEFANGELLLNGTPTPFPLGMLMGGQGAAQP